MRCEGGASTAEKRYIEEGEAGQGESGTKPAWTPVRNLRWTRMIEGCSPHRTKRGGIRASPPPSYLHLHLHLHLRIRVRTTATWRLEIKILNRKPPSTPTPTSESVARGERGHEESEGKTGVMRRAMGEEGREWGDHPEDYEDEGEDEGKGEDEVGMEVKARAGAACYAGLDIVCAARSREAQPKSYSGRRQGRRWRRRSIDTRTHKYPSRGVLKGLHVRTPKPMSKTGIAPDDEDGDGDRRSRRGPGGRRWGRGR
ncbi:hypothetical protein B0H13DRAFT_2297137 [Mycena leptocephala]|nr:hypothetical protein B0H13DRAFT_2297137 [Mycena leptocephala]